MTINKITPIETNNRRVLTTAQLAEAYETSMQIITNNFNRNKARYKEGKHYYLLQGALLQAFRATNQNDLLPQNVHKLYLWTETGALLLAKSLNTEKAWEVYMYLVDFYFRVKSALVKDLQAALEKSERIGAAAFDRIAELKEEVATLYYTATADFGEQEQLRQAARLNVREIFGGSTASVSYRVFARTAYKTLWQDYRKHFRLDSYRNTPEYRISEGLSFIREWEPDKHFRKAVKAVESDFLVYLETFYDDFNRDGYKQLLADCPCVLEEYINALR